MFVSILARWKMSRFAALEMKCTSSLGILSVQTVVKRFTGRSGERQWFFS